MNARVIVLLLTLLSGAAAQAGPHPVVVRLTGIDAGADAWPVSLIARTAEDSANVRELLAAGPRTVIALAAGQWFVSASRPGFWSEPVLLFVTGPSEVVIRLYPTTRLRAEVAAPRLETVRSVSVQFLPAEAASGHPGSSVTCPVQSGRLLCDLPAGLYDLAFRIPGHVSIYRWNIDLRDPPERHLGALTFRPGSTLTGHVALPAAGRVPSLEAVTVSLRRASAGQPNDETVRRATITRTVAAPNRRGFFSFEVAAGTYLVSASAEGLASPEREVTVIEGREAALNDPLQLDPLSTLTVRVRVPPEGATRAWKVAAIRAGADGETPDEQLLAVPADGIARFTGLSGTYDGELRLADSVWAAQRTRLNGDTTIDLAARAIKVRGSLHLGDEPLAARILFSSRKQRFHVPVQAGPGGTFVAFLPEVHENVWERVEIQSATPWVKRVIEDVALEGTSDGEATIDIRLPATRIFGTVIDERGRTVKSGLINMSGPDGAKQFEMEHETFAFEGLRPGRYALTGSTRDRESSDALFVEIGEEEQEREVTLKVAPVSNGRGAVVSSGGPVIGASVFIVPANSAHRLVVPVPVDAEGAFEYRLPPETRDIVIGLTAPGFAFRMMRMPAPASKLELAVDQNGGVLTIDASAGARAKRFRPYVIHNGAILSAMTVAYLGRGRFAGGTDELVHFELESAEEGLYLLCLLTDDEERAIRIGAPPDASRCASGVLARHGALRLRAPDVRP